MASESSAELVKSLEDTHPDYQWYENYWTLYRDVYLGQWDNGLKSKYLVKGRVEPPSDFQQRVNMSEFVSESTIAIKRLVSSLYKDMPTREDLSSGLVKFADKTTRINESIDIFMQRAVAHATAYGCSHILIDKRASQETGDKEMPFATLYDPLDVINWETDPDGNLVWVRVMEIVSFQPTPRTPRTTFAIFREFDRVNWVVYRVPWDIASRKISAVTPPSVLDRGRHGLGMVPLVTVYPLEQIKPMIGKSYISQAAYEDIRAFRLESDLTWDIYMHAHPYLALWMFETLSEHAIGSSTFLQLKPKMGTNEAEDARYLNPPATVFEASFKAIEQARRNVHRQVGIDPLGVMEDSSDQPSGVSRAWSFSTSEGRLLAFIADNIEQAEYNMFSIVAKYLGDKEPDLENIRYPDTFDLVSALDLIKGYNEVESHIKSPTFRAAMLKRIGRHMVGDISQANFTKMDQEIDKAVKDDLAAEAKMQANMQNATDGANGDGKVGGLATTAKPTEVNRGNRQAKAGAAGSKSSSSAER